MNTQEQYSAVELNSGGATGGFDNYTEVKAWIESEYWYPDAPAMAIVNSEGKIEAIYADCEWFT